MCTMTLVATANRLRVMFNRDERHTRPEAWHPRTMRIGHGTALMPIDPQGGGTWIAATSAGLVFALLNGEGSPASGAPSRGAIIPLLAGHRSIDDVIGAARSLCGRTWPAHRLLVVDHGRAAELSLRPTGLDVTRISLARPVMVTSASADAGAIVPARRALFDSLVPGAADRLAAQEAFHHYRSTEWPQASIHVRRHDAATHSSTTIDVRADGTAMRYEPVRRLVGRPAWTSLPRARATVATSTPAELALVS